MEAPEAAQPHIEGDHSIPITNPLASLNLSPSTDAQTTNTTTNMPPSSAPPPTDAAPSTDAAALPAATAADTITLGPSNDALRAEIVRQVEFYFSDANIITDDFLLSSISRGGPEGWVPIKIIASFAKMKKLTRNIATIVAALRTSIKLQVSAEGARVRRLAPLPNVDLDEVRRRSVIAWNLPWDKPLIEDVIKLFEKAGKVAMARIRKPDHPEPLLTRGVAAEVAKGAREYYALVEYATEGDAAKAVRQLHDDSSWRSGLKVRALLPLLPAPGAAGGPAAAGLAVARNGGTQKLNKKVANVEMAVGGKEGAAGAGAPAAAAPSAQLEERPRPSWATQKKKNKADYAAWASAGTAAAFDKAAAGEGGAAVPTVPAAEGNGKPSMPDGGRGFGMGRGKPPPGAWTPPVAAPGSAAAPEEAAVAADET